MDIGICISDGRYRNTIGQAKSNRIAPQIAFKGLNSVPKTRVSSNFKNYFNEFKLCMLRTFCKPKKRTVNDTCSTIIKFMFPYGYDINNKKITDIFNMLDIHSSNKEYSEFVKDGIGFLEKIQKSKNSKFYCDYGYNTAMRGRTSIAGKEGFSLIRTVEKAFKKAIRPSSKIDDNALQTDIKNAREYMATFDGIQG